MNIYRPTFLSRLNREERELYYDYLKAIQRGAWLNRNNAFINTYKDGIPHEFSKEKCDEVLRNFNILLEKHHYIKFEVEAITKEQIRIEASNYYVDFLLRRCNEFASYNLGKFGQSEKWHHDYLRQQLINIVRLNLNKAEDSLKYRLKEEREFSNANFDQGPGEDDFTDFDLHIYESFLSMMRLVALTFADLAKLNKYYNYLQETSDE